MMAQWKRHCLVNTKTGFESWQKQFDYLFGSAGPKRERGIGQQGGWHVAVSDENYSFVPKV